MMKFLAHTRGPEGNPIIRLQAETGEVLEFPAPEEIPEERLNLMLIVADALWRIRSSATEEERQQWSEAKKEPLLTRIEVMLSLIARKLGLE
jgi:hypothetical protein